MDTENIQNEELVSPEIMEAMGISQPAFEEVMGIIGRMPTVQELSTLLAMWDANGRQQSLYGWLKGQHHVVEKHEYLYNGPDTTHKEIREPRVKDCIDFAKQVMQGLYSNPEPDPVPSAVCNTFTRSQLIYMVGNVSTEFLNSEYAKRCLHIVDNPVKLATAADDVEYLQLILGSLFLAEVISSIRPVGRGGLFATLVACCALPFGKNAVPSSSSSWRKRGSIAASWVMLPKAACWSTIWTMATSKSTSLPRPDSLFPIRTRQPVCNRLRGFLRTSYCMV